MRNFLTFLALQTVSYALITYNYRSIAHDRLAFALLTDGVYASFNFFVIRKIAKSDDSIVSWFGYVVGSLIGTSIGMWL